MEILPEGKNFRLVKEEEFSEILSFLEKFLPDSLKFHQTLKTFINDKVWDFYFYVSKSWPEIPIILHFPGVTRTPNGKLYESFSIFCPSDQMDHLEELANEDILIDWSEPIYLNFTHELVLAKIEKFYTGIGVLEKTYGEVFSLTSPSALQGNEITSTTRFKENAEIRQLTKENAQTIHDLYPANHMESIEVFEKLIEKLPCYGMFSTSGDLAAWMVQSYYGAMFSMQTLPEFRRKGYGLVLARHLTKKVLDRDYLPFVIIRPENDASKSLYTKLGFSKSFNMIRAILTPFSADATSRAVENGTQQDD